MADAVLCFGTHLGKGEAACFSGSEDWVVSESTFAGTLRQYLAFHDAFEESFLSILNEGYDCTEASLACLCLFNLVEQASYVGIGIMAFAISVHGTETSRIDSWCSAECIYLQASVVGKTIYAVVLMDISCLLQGIALQRVGRLGDVLGAADVAQLP